MAEYSIYGIHLYGTAFYGVPPTFEFHLDYFRAIPQEYDSIRVQWSHPSGDWDRLRLVRGNFGFPVDETDGRILLEVTDPHADPVTYLDANVTPLRFHYYSMFLRQAVSNNWVRAGNAPLLMLKNYGTSERLYELTPGVFRNDDIFYISSNTNSGMLQSLLEAVGYQCDILRSELESLLWSADPEKMSGGLLPHMAAQLGFPYEAELGMDLVRRQLFNAIYLYKKKGTRPGVEGAVSVLTGWAPIVVSNSPGTVDITLLADRVNLVTNPSAEVDTAGWTQGTNTVLTRDLSQHAYGTASFKLAATAGGNVSMLTATGLSGMPVTAGLSYMASMYNTQPSGTVRNVRVDIAWYDVAGAQIGSTVLGTAIPQVLGAWTARPSVRATAPAGAKTAAMVATVVAAGAAETHFFDGALFEQTDRADLYFDGTIGSPIADYLWAGTAHNSQSHYYRRRTIRNSRLIVRLPDFLPAGVTFTLHYAGSVGGSSDVYSDTYSGSY